MLVNIRKIKDDVELARRYLLVRYPYLYSVIAKCPIIITSKGTSAVDGKNIYVCESFWRSLKPREKLALILHEALHNALRHPQRASDFTYKGTWNKACDVVVNIIIKSLKMPLPPGALDEFWASQLLNLPASDIRRMSADELYYRLLRHIKERGTEEFIVAGSSTAQEGEGGMGGAVEKIDALSKGDPSPEDLVLANMYAKGIGTLPGLFEIVVGEVLKGRINWRQLLRIHLGEIFGIKFRSTWVRMNRRNPRDFPGYRVLRNIGMPKRVYVLLDISGSVVSEPKLLSRFFGEVLEIAKHHRCEVIVVPWDTEVKRELVRRVRTVQDVVSASWRGGGGTIIDDALIFAREEVVRFKRFGGTVAVIVLTDGMLYCNVRGVAEDLAKLADKAVYAYTVEENPDIFKSWIRVRVS